ncbi:MULTISPECIES: methylenetetrahydrofolate reductase [unclassified Photobacterium]|uniref:methylenetetrahydrofolate reductase n=1 Tax=unclassified Photobacterium TaxID=2628852 RepID=UPI001EE01FBC|nr:MULTISPECIES: methylenetetrahydrofolate reductase [unclassified Photobacterium]MCG3862624.1 methylenetetrahydrofolate reductase [Photobacterium sp. Ph6]MCG3874155.1 methylenetetrahydrofolate reductase [Photobacterium sp. Ph5]
MSDQFQPTPESELRVRYNDITRGVYFIGTTPPKTSTPIEDVEGIADRLVDRIRDLAIDGLIVYDIQDEASRTNKPRPFPFKSTHDPRHYSSLLNKKTDRPVITYKSVVQSETEAFDEWLNEAWDEYRVRDMVLVGSPSAKNDVSLPLSTAYQTLAENRNDFFTGGIMIAERHAKKGNEHERLIEKYKQGCNFFISQAIYDTQATIDILTRYAIECKEQGLKPQRIILTFSPCGSAKTLEFIEWLGVSVPEATSLRILNAENPLHESIKMCCNSLNQILDAVVEYDLPLGLNIESLTNRKEEIDGSILLYKLLRSSMDSHLAKHEFRLLKRKARANKLASA